jgi:hypothetical protein
LHFFSFPSHARDDIPENSIGQLRSIPTHQDSFSSKPSQNSGHMQVGDYNNSFPSKPIPSQLSSSFFSQ